MYFLSLYVFMSLCQKHNILSFLLFTLKNMHFLPSVFFVFMSFCLKIIMSFCLKTLPLQL